MVRSWAHVAWEPETVDRVPAAAPAANPLIAGGNRALARSLAGAQPRVLVSPLIGACSAPRLARTLTVDAADKLEPRQVGEWRAKVRNALAQLVAGVATVDVDQRSGAVRLEYDPDNPKLKGHKGFELLRRVTENPHAVRITPEGKEAMARVHEKDIEAASTAGRGSGSTIDFPLNPNPAVAAEAFYAVVGRDGPEPERDTPESVMLGHELIHSDHAQRGVFVPMNRGDTSENRYGSGLAENVEQEEMRTVGLPGARLGPADVTENALRQQLDLPPRVSYRPHKFNVEKKAAAELEVAKAAAVTQLEAAIEETSGALAAVFGKGIPKPVSDDIHQLWKALSGAQSRLKPLDEGMYAANEALLEQSKRFLDG